jgi:hypothetical protein
MNNVDISVLVDEEITSIKGLEQYSYVVGITTKSGKVFTFYHEQDCCENVSLEDFDGDITHLQNSVILSAEERVSSKDYDDGMEESGTWTFYEIKTTKGDLWMRWLGTSNGYYSESVEVLCTNTDSK